MFFRIERNDFVEVLAKASKVVPGKGDDHLRALHLSCEQGSDGPLTVRATGGGVEFTAEAQAGVVAEGSAVVLGTGLHKLVKSLAAGEIAVEAEEDVVNVSQGKDVYRLPLAGSKYDPDFSPFPEKGAVSWSGDFLSGAIGRVLPFVCVEDAMEGMACMHVFPGPDGKVMLEGLDGFNLARVHFVNQDVADMLPRKKGILIHRAHLSLLRAVLTDDAIEVSLDDKRFYVRTRADFAQVLSLPRMQYDFPDVTALVARMQNPTSTARFSHAVLDAALTRLSLFHTDTERGCYYDLTSDEAVLRARSDKGTARASLAVESQGDTERIAIPTKQLQEAMNHFASTDLLFGITGPSAPISVTGDDDADYLAGVMPLNVTEVEGFQWPED